MKPVTERLRNLLVIPILIAVLLTGTGCSMLIASRGVSSLPAIVAGSTRQEVRRALGDPESSEARSDGTRIETYRIRRKVESAWGDFWTSKPGGSGGSAGSPGMGGILLIPIGLGYEVYATGKAIADSEKQMIHLVLGYGPDDRLLYFDDMNASPGERFDFALRPLTASLWNQLENDECATWSVCLALYRDELRKRAALVGYTLPAKGEENVQRLLDVARDRDEGSITKGQALIRSAGLYKHIQGENALANARYIGTRGTLTEALWTRYQTNARYFSARDTLNAVVRTQLEHDVCPAWLPCLTTYGDELRREAAVVGYAWASTDEENSRHLLAVARDRDEGRITKAEALIGVGIAGREGSYWSLRLALGRQLKVDGCPSWVVCVTYHENERRRRAALENHPITAEEEIEMRQRLKIAADVDQGKMTKADALETLRELI
jgi:hypothetical protein